MQLFQRAHTDDSPKEKELVFQIFLLGSLPSFWSNAKEITKVLACKCKQWVHEWTKGRLRLLW